ncbi:MAG TPA: hypothetical protein VFC93_21155 [Chloroflexota bacterium]|nr:hypothetical protein [Chloroflexota bacterium]
MARRLTLVLGILLFLKLVARFTLIGAFTDAAIQFFAIIDAAAIVLASAWVASGQPRAQRHGARRRAMASAGLLTLGAWAMNVLLQAPLMAARSSDTLEAVLRLLMAGLANAALAGPIGGLAVWLLASVVAWAWLLARMPAPPRRAGGRGAAVTLDGSPRERTNAQTAVVRPRADRPAARAGAGRPGHNQRRP